MLVFRSYLNPANKAGKKAVAIKPGIPANEEGLTQFYDSNQEPKDCKRFNFSSNVMKRLK